MPASGSADGVRLWPGAMLGGGALDVLPGAAPAAFSADDAWLAFARRNPLVLWNLQRKEEVSLVSGLGGPRSGVVVSPDGGRLEDGRLVE